MSDTNSEQDHSVDIQQKSPHPDTPPTAPVAVQDKVVLPGEEPDKAQKLDDVRAKLRVGIYKGLTDHLSIARGKKDYEHQWNRKEGEHITYDGLVAEAVERAVAEGRDKVVVFDFGCGEGIAMQSFVSDRDSEAMSLIKQHPEVNVELIGVTDTTGLRNAPTTQEALAAGTELKSADADPPNLSAKMDYYAVTAARPLEAYLEEHGIDTIDVGMAVQSLAYLPARNFAATMESITKRLHNPGSTFIAAPYATQVPGFVNYGGLPYLDVRTKGRDPSVNVMLRDGGRRFYGNEDEMREEIPYLEAALQKYVNLGRITPEQIDEAINSWLPRNTVASNRWHHRRPTLEQILRKTENPGLALGQVTLLLSDADKTYFLERQKQLREQKQGALTALQEQYGGSIDISFDEHVIQMRNKAA